MTGRERLAQLRRRWTFAAELERRAFMAGVAAASSGDRAARRAANQEQDRAAAARIRAERLTWRVIERGRA